MTDVNECVWLVDRRGNCPDEQLRDAADRHGANLIFYTGIGERSGPAVQMLSGASTQAIRAAERAAAERMRERCAALAFRYVGAWDGEADSMIEGLVDEIRALPLEGDE